MKKYLILSVVAVIGIGAGVFVLFLSDEGLEKTGSTSVNSNAVNETNKKSKSWISNSSSSLKNDSSEIAYTDDSKGRKRIEKIFDSRNPEFENVAAIADALEIRLKTDTHAKEFRKLAQNNITAAAYYLQMLPEGWDVQPYLKEIVEERLRNGDQKNAADWFESVALDPEFEAEMTARVMYNWVEDSPQNAAKWLSGRAERGREIRGADFVAVEIARTDPKSAADWVISLPHSSSHTQEALKKVIQEWAAKDVVKAGKFLNAIPSSSHFDSAIEVYAQEIAFKEPRVAIDWAESIKDQELRRSTIKKVTDAWISREPEEAKQFLNNR